MRTICAWCGDIITPENGTGGPDSHGICQSCKSQFDESVPTCPHFKPSSVFAPWLCYWWSFEDVYGVQEWFCSRPAWDEKICPTAGVKVKE